VLGVSGAVAGVATGAGSAAGAAGATGAAASAAGAGVVVGSSIRLILIMYVYDTRTSRLQPHDKIMKMRHGDVIIHSHYA
jgi:hypothetical protein